VLQQCPFVPIATIVRSEWLDCPQKVPQNYTHTPLIFQAELCIDMLTEKATLLDDNHCDRKLHGARTYSIIVSPSFFAYPLAKLEASACPHAKGNKKAQSHHTHVYPSNGRLRLQ
jgi:hypothetical protein